MLDDFYVASYRLDPFTVGYINTLELTKDPKKARVFKSDSIQFDLFKESNVKLYKLGDSTEANHDV